MRLAYPEPTVQVQPHTGQHVALAEPFLAACTPLDGLPAKVLARHDAAAWVGSTGSGRYVAKLTSANVGGGRSWAISRTGDTVGCLSTRWSTEPQASEADPCMVAL